MLSSKARKVDIHPNKHLSRLEGQRFGHIQEGQKLLFRVQNTTGETHIGLTQATKVFIDFYHLNCRQSIYSRLQWILPDHHHHPILAQMPSFSQAIDFGKMYQHLFQSCK
jgi:hypothetical protein